MHADLIQQESLSTDAIWRQPDEDFFIPDDVEHQTAYDAAAERVQRATEMPGDAAAIITDDDADGLGAALVVDTAYDSIAIIPAGPHGTLDVRDALDLILTDGDETLDVWGADIRLEPTDDGALLSALDAVATRNSVRWFDHHEWDADTQDAVADLVDTLVIDPGHDVPQHDERCAAELVCDYVREQGTDIPAHIREAVRVTGVYDCWKKTDDDEFIDERADDLADYADLVDEPEPYLEAVGEHGADIAAEESIADALADYRALRADLDDLAVEETTYYVLNTETGEMPPVSDRNLDRLREEGPKEPEVERVIAITYGRCNTNAVADRLNTLADATAVVKPGGGLSFRSRGAFDACHRVAARFDGGGHESAAGAHVTDGERGIDLDSMVAYGEHWSTNGRDARRAVRRAFKDVLVDESAN